MNLSFLIELIVVISAEIVEYFTGQQCMVNNFFALFPRGMWQYVQSQFFPGKRKSEPIL